MYSSTIEDEEARLPVDVHVNKDSVIGAEADGINGRLPLEEVTDANADAAAEVKGKDDVGRLPVSVDTDVNIAADVEAEELDVVAAASWICLECWAWISFISSSESKSSFWTLPCGKAWLTTLCQEKNMLWTDTYEFHHDRVSFAQEYNRLNIIASSILTIHHIKTKRSIWPAFWAHLGVVLSVRYDCDLLADLCMIPQYKTSVPWHEHRQSSVEWLHIVPKHDSSPAWMHFSQQSLWLQLMVQQINECRPTKTNGQH